MTIPASLDATVRILHATPHVLRALLGTLPDALVRADYGPDTFSAFDVIGHLILGERLDWIPRTRHVLEHGDAVEFPPFPWDGTDAETAQCTLEERLDVFTDLRATNLRELDALALTEATLERTGLHPVFGPVRLGTMLATWSTHDTHHVAQICKALNFQFRDAIGPWRPYTNSIPPEPAPR